MIGLGIQLKLKLNFMDAQIFWRKLLLLFLALNASTLSFHTTLPPEVDLHIYSPRPIGSPLS